MDRLALMDDQRTFRDLFFHLPLETFGGGQVQEEGSDITGVQVAGVQRQEGRQVEIGRAHV